MEATANAVMSIPSFRAYMEVAVLLFGAFMMVGLLGGRFLRLLARGALRPFAALRR
jgi:hypothetical protein